MENLIKNLPDQRPIFRSADEYEIHGSPLISYQAPRSGRLRWLVLVALLVGLWGVAMAGQLASHSLLHQGAPVVGELSGTEGNS